MVTKIFCLEVDLPAGEFEKDLNPGLLYQQKNAFGTAVPRLYDITK